MFKTLLNALYDNDIQYDESVYEMDIIIKPLIFI